MSTVPASEHQLRPAPPSDLGPIIRTVIGTAGLTLSALCVITLGKLLLGLAPVTAAGRNLAIVLHVASAVPALPLGAYLLLASKGTPRHKLLGKVWIALMVTAAFSALFIRHLNDGNFSWIHILVPVTLLSAWQAVASARAGNIARHKVHLARLYLLALILPGVLAFIPTRLMGFWLFG